MKPSVGRFKIFGSLCYKHELKQLIRKLDDRSQAMILAGYHSTSAYKLFSPNENKVYISRDMQLYERKLCKWLKVPSNPLQESENLSHINTALQDDQETEIVQTHK